ncbi:MAG TPA: hypothetical protein VKN99_21870 [Polyangia bacterium]|nr:hypothetical protein [Polyangia bacterium]
MTLRLSFLLLLVGACGSGRPGACATDDDCIFRTNAGCCGQCLAKDDPVPPPIPCRAACPQFIPSCLCHHGQCGIGTLTQGAACDLQRDDCAVGLKCCATCCGVPPPDGGTYDPRPQCVQPAIAPPPGPGGYCPPVALGGGAPGAPGAAGAPAAITVLSSSPGGTAPRRS